MPDNSRQFDSSKNTLASAQQEFQSAISNVSNDFASAKDDVKKVAGDWNGFKLDKPEGSKKGVDQSLQAVNRSLYNASGKLNSSIAKASEVSTAFADASQNLKTQVQNNADRLRNELNQSSNDFVTPSIRSLSNISPLKVAQEKSTSGFDNKMPVRRSNGLAPMTSIASKRTGPLTPNDLAKNEKSELMRMQTEMAEARKQIERLQKQVTAAQESSKVANNSLGTYNGSLSNFNPSQPPINQPPTNRLRASQSAPLANSTDDSGFPSTGLSGFSNLNKNGAPRVNGEITPALRATFATPQTDSPIGNSVSKASIEVDIPDSVLKGKGSYSPGSVNQLLK